MKVKCIHSKPTDKHTKILGEHYMRGKQDFGLRVGKEYLVYGISTRGLSPWIEIESDSGYLYSVPLLLFEIIDNRISKYWKVDFNENGMLLLFPEEFFQEFFFDDLFEEKPDVVESFSRLKSKMLNE